MVGWWIWWHHIHIACVSQISSQGPRNFLYPLCSLSSYHHHHPNPKAYHIMTPPTIPPYHHINIRHHPTLSFFISFYIFFPLSKEKVRLEDLDVGIGIEAKKILHKRKSFFLLLFQFLDYILQIHFFSLYLPSANHVIFYDDASFQVSVYVIFIVLPG